MAVGIIDQVNYDDLTVVIMLNIGAQVMGVVVDCVSDVITLTPEQLRPVPEISSAIGSDHLLDIVKLMSSAEMGLVNESIH